MKRFAPLCILLLCIHFSMQIPKYENCDRQVLTGDDVKSCVLVRCGGISGVAFEYCNLIACRQGTQIGYHNGDKNAEYPACCSYPICESSRRGYV